MLRVSSYRKLFEEGWGRNGGASVQCAGQYRASADCDKLDFVASRALNKEGLNRFVQDRIIIAGLNDRLVQLIELAHCFEEENECLECQIADLEDRLGSTESSISSTVAVPDSSLDAVVQRLRTQRDEIWCDCEALRKELERLKEQCEKTSQQRSLVQQERQFVSEDVDAVTAECLALREQVAIYEEQLANMEGQHETELQMELAELEKYNEELEEQVDINKTSYAEEIAELECTIDEMKHQEADLQFQMKEQCEDYRELLGQKMAREMEICAY
uniref:IF rod domain-containing protein n=1 Tax=Periophthalmus magnuspinnatus TaxID=409849 RepID=A0A3B4ASX0_9GOBI